MQLQNTSWPFPSERGFITLPHHQMSENATHLTQKEKIQHISDSGEGVIDGILGYTGHSSPEIPQQWKKMNRSLLHNTAVHERYYLDEPLPHSQSDPSPQQCPHQYGQYHSASP
jgi:hypothetical protein